jgi:hypothetical protein
LNNQTHSVFGRNSSKLNFFGGVKGRNFGQRGGQDGNFWLNGGRVGNFGQRGGQGGHIPPKITILLPKSVQRTRIRSKDNFLTSSGSALVQKITFSVTTAPRRAQTLPFKLRRFRCAAKDNFLGRSGSALGQKITFLGWSASFPVKKLAKTRYFQNSP